MNTKPYKFLCNMKVLCSIQNLPYMVVGSSRHRKHVTQLSWIATYGHWIISVTENMLQSFPEEPCLVVGSSMFQKYVTKFPEWLYMVNGLLVLRKHVTRFYWIAIVIWWQMMASITKILLHKFPNFWQVARKYASFG